MGYFIENAYTNQIWTYLVRQLGFTQAGAAGVMGNLAEESLCNPLMRQGHDGDTQEQLAVYTAQVNSGAVSKNTFIHDEKGYGLCQWTFYTRKEALYNLAKQKGKSIGDLSVQLLYLDNELAGYSSMLVTLRTSNDVATCSDAWMTLFERPADQSEAAKQKRRKMANQYYNKLAKGVVTNSSENQVGKLLSFAQSQIGMTYPNYQQKGVTEITIGSHWCAAFVSYCFTSAGFAFTKRNVASQIWQDYKDRRIRDVDALQPGDIVFFRSKGNSYNSMDSSATSGIFEHVGIVKSKNSDGTYQCIEGNTSKGSYPGWAKSSVLEQKRYTTQVRNSSLYIVAGIRYFQYIDGTPAYTDDIVYTQSILDLTERFKGLLDQKYSVTGGALEYKEVEAEINSSRIISADIDANEPRTIGTSLLTTPTLVESPFIILKVGEYTFGSYTKKGSLNNFNSSLKVTYPNYMTAIDVVKINGTVNQYTIQMVYQIEAGNDPNLLDKIFSKVGYGTIYITYGDWSAPSFIYKEEEAIITGLTSNIDFSNSRITYTLKCTSNALALMGGYYNFESKNIKPSTTIIDMLYSQDSTYHLLDVFPGMRNRSKVEKAGLIKKDDAIVKVESKQGMDALSYINYLVSCMSNRTENTTGLKESNYYLTICDDTKGEFGGTYFKISKVTSNANSITLDSSNVYEVDVGYPGNSLVTGFNINNDNSWALIYNYSQSVVQDTYNYSIDNKGNLIETASPNILLSSQYGRVTETQRDWWTKMTQFPITATLQIKGLLRPAMLMTYVRINALFFGQRHISSGLYVVTKQQDRIDVSGYRTTLSLTRVAGDLDTIFTETKKVKSKVPVYGSSGKTNAEVNYGNFDPTTGILKSTDYGNGVVYNVAPSMAGPIDSPGVVSAETFKNLFEGIKNNGGKKTK